MTVCDIQRIAIKMKLTKIGDRGKLYELQRKLLALTQAGSVIGTSPASEPQRMAQQVDKQATVKELLSCVARACRMCAWACLQCVLFAALHVAQLCCKCPS